MFPLLTVGFCRRFSWMEDIKHQFNPPCPSNIFSVGINLACCNQAMKTKHSCGNTLEVCICSTSPATEQLTWSSSWDFCSTAWQRRVSIPEVWMPRTNIQMAIKLPFHSSIYYTYSDSLVAYMSAQRSDIMIQGCKALNMLVYTSYNLKHPQKPLTLPFQFRKGSAIFENDLNHCKKKF